MEAFLSKLDPFINDDLKENFHEYLGSVTNIMSNNVYRDKDNTFKLLNRLRKNERIVVLSADKEFYTVILEVKQIYFQIKKTYIQKHIIY